MAARGNPRGFRKWAQLGAVIPVTEYYADPEIAVNLYKAFYQKSPFVTIVDSNPDLKMVVNTNKAVLYVRKYGDKIHIISMLDNLLKGASGQAIENMNIMFGLPQDAGLRLKASKF